MKKSNLMKQSLIDNTPNSIEELDDNCGRSGYLWSKILGFIGGIILAILYSTSKIVNVKLFFDPQKFKINQKPVILLFWHEKIILTACCQKKIQQILGNRTIYSLISGHKDGQILSFALKLFGLQAVPGSSSSGGSRALIALKNVLNNGFHTAITPDGPRGPRRQIKPGAVKLAQLSGSLIVPIGTSVNRQWKFSSWDKMSLLKPFARVSIAFGEPLVVPRRISTEEFNHLVKQAEQRLIQVTEWVDQISYV